MPSFYARALLGLTLAVSLVADVSAATTPRKSTTTTTKKTTTTTTKKTTTTKTTTTTKASTTKTSTTTLRSTSSATTTSASNPSEVPVAPVFSSAPVASASPIADAPTVNATADALGGHTVANTILVFARDQASSYSATSGLNGYGIPYQLILVPSTGIALPALNSTATSGNYGGIIVLGEVSYAYGTSFASALTADQWTALYNYQTAFSVRMVRLDVYPGPNFGTATAIDGAGCCDTGVEQLVSFTNTSAFSTANVKVGAGVTSQGLWHYPAVITNSSNTWEIASFAAGGSFTSASVAAVINNFDGRQQMAWFTSFATEWSASSNYLQHAHIHWVTRGLFVGGRKSYFLTQIDDVHLETDIYSPAGTSFRIRPADLQAHVSWMTSLNSRLPAGSSYIVELGHNGNGDIEAATNTGSASCTPDVAIEYDEQIDTTLEFQKPLGTGADIWPTTPTSYSWSLACAKVDALASWILTPANRDAYLHISHTFTHEQLNNATYHDASREISFNQAWLTQTGISAGKFASKGLIPPAITGLHNGDAIRAWMDNGITAVVGDNTRSVLMNQQNEFWPLISNVASNGYAGLVIMPRWATTIYYNCDTPSCTTAEWIATSAGSGDFTTLLADAKTTNTRHLLGLHHDPFMFHQANLRQTDAATYTVGTQSGKMSLLMIWVETVAQEMTRLTNWPLITLGHDELAVQFTNRMARDACAPNLSYQYSVDGTTISSVTITANGNTCSVPIPVTVPTTGSVSGTSTTDKVGSEPTIYWVKLSGSPVKISFSAPIAA